MENVDPAFVKGVTMGLGAIGPAIGLGLVGAAAVTAVGRNPEVQGKVLTMALIMAGLVDAITIFVLLIIFMG